MSMRDRNTYFIIEEIIEELKFVDIFIRDLFHYKLQSYLDNVYG